MTVESLELEEIAKDQPKGDSVVGNYLDLIKNVQVSLDVYVGGASIKVGELFELKENSVVKLDKLLNDPLEVYLDGKLIAKGALAAVDDNFAIKITEINNAALKLDVQRYKPQPAFGPYCPFSGVGNCCFAAAGGRACSGYRASGTITGSQ